MFDTVVFEPAREPRQLADFRQSLIQAIVGGGGGLRDNPRKIVKKDEVAGQPVWQMEVGSTPFRVVDATAVDVWLLQGVLLVRLGQGRRPMHIVREDGKGYVLMIGDRMISDRDRPTPPTYFLKLANQIVGDLVVNGHRRVDRYLASGKKRNRGRRESRLLGQHQRRRERLW